MSLPLADVPRAPEPVWITSVAVFDSESGTVSGPRDVQLEDGRIVRIEPAGFAPRDEAAVDGTGDTLLPGLVDLHVHLGAVHAYPGHLIVPDAKENLAAMAWAGVTTVLDLSHKLSAVEQLQRHIDDGRIPGPRIYASGRPFGADGGHPVSSLRATYPSLLVAMVTPSLAWEVADGPDLERPLAREGGRDALKVMLDTIPLGVPVIPDEALAALAAAADRLGVPLMAHVGRPEDVDRALSAPVDALAHAPYAGALSDGQIAALRDRKIPVVATLSVWECVEEVALGRPSLDALEAAVLPKAQERDVARSLEGKAPLPAPMADWAAGLVAHHDDRLENVRRMHAAGVRILVGSDSPNIGHAPGVGLHAEIDQLRAVGMSPAEVLTAVTWENSRFLDPQATFGAIRPGWEADLLLVDGDPLTDPDAVHRIREVWIDGRRVARGAR